MRFRNDRDSLSTLYNYPRCCIEAFKARYSAFTLLPVEGAVAVTHGFIPCDLSCREARGRLLVVEGPDLEALRDFEEEARRRGLYERKPPFTVVEPCLKTDV